MSTTESHLLFPLTEFERNGATELPDAAVVDGDTVPEPFRGLLVHKHDMTSTLESFHGERIHLSVLDSRHDTDRYLRKVLLLLDTCGIAVEYGAICIYLDRFPAAVREQISEGRCPLGTIMSTFDVAHSSRPRAYFKIAACTELDEGLDALFSGDLYGRSNCIVDQEGEPLADIVEILPQISPGPG